MKRIKKILLLGVLMLLATSLFAQLAVGLRGGITLPDKTIEYDNISVSSDNYLGFAVAGVVELEFSDYFAIQPEIAFVQKGTKMKFEEGFIGETIESKDRLNYLEVPILAKAKFGNESFGAYAMAGPTFGYAVSGYSEVDGDKHTYDGKDWDGFNRFELGSNFGVGVGVNVGTGMAFADARYMMSILDLSDVEGETIRNKGFIFSVGYLADLW